MGLYSIFFKSNVEFNPQTFEKDLDEILRKISIAEKRLVNFRQTSNKFKRQLLIWLSAAYIVYLAYLYQSQKYYYNDRNKYFIISAFIAPLFVHLINQILKFYNQRILRYYLNKIKFYKKQHQQKINDLKTKTNFNKTRSLLQKYSVQDFNKIKDNEVNFEPEHDDQGTSLPTDKRQSPLRYSRESSTKNDNKKKHYLHNHKRQGGVNKGDEEFNNDHLQDAYEDDDDELKAIEQRYQEQAKIRKKRELIRAGLYNPDNKKNIVQKIFDILVGTDESSPNNRYALICINCFTHNGLAPPRYLPNQVKFRCLKCRTLNNPDANNSSALSSPKAETFGDEKNANIENVISSPASSPVSSPVNVQEQKPQSDN